MMRLFGKKKPMDERERMEMYKTEHYAFYVLYFGIAVDYITRRFIFGMSPRECAWEALIFFGVSVWVIIASLRRGNYDYFTEPGWKSYLFYSLIFSVIFTAFLLAVGAYKGWIDSVKDACLAGGVEFLFMFVLIYGALALFGGLTKLRRKKLEQEYED